VGRGDWAFRPGASSSPILPLRLSHTPGDAATVASGALKKLGKTALGALGGLLDSGKGSSSTPETRRAPPQRPTSRPGDEGDGDIFSWPGSAGRGGPLAGGRSGAGGPLAGLVGGLVGRALGGVLSGVAGALASQAADAAALRDRALAALQSDSAVLAAFGGRPVPAPGPTSQAGSTVVVNGVAQKRLTLRFSVGGPAGTGTVEVSSAGEGTPPDVRVRCPDGRVVSVSGSSGRGGGGWRGGGNGGGRVGGGSGGGGGAGDVIDVDFREL